MRSILVAINSLLTFLLALQTTQAWQQLQGTRVSRRQALLGGCGLVIFGGPATAVAADPDSPSTTTVPPLELRDRKNNKDALIREDYWYQTGRLPPRRLESSIRSSEEVAFNAFGSCTSADGGNPCTYVSLKQRAPAYAKYGSTIAAGADEFAQVGRLLRQGPTPAWDAAERLLRADYGSAAVDAELKLVLLATALLVSPNFPTPSKELLVARFYANEVHAAHDALRQAVQAQDRPQAIAAWEFGRDAWNSYFVVVNRSISPKVGETFRMIE